MNYEPPNLKINLKQKDMTTPKKLKKEQVEFQ